MSCNPVEAELLLPAGNGSAPVRHLPDSPGADAAHKAARFLQLCNAHGLPLVSLVDTPGVMVGPTMEERAQVRQ